MRWVYIRGEMQNNTWLYKQWLLNYVAHHACFCSACKVNWSGLLLILIKKCYFQINDDFAILYPDKINRFRECWKIFMQRLIELKKEEINSDEHKKDLLNSINSNDTEGK